jgi:hypothetical protein
MPNAGPDKKDSAQEPKKPVQEGLNPPTEEEDAEESKDATASPDKRTWQ